MVDEKGTLTLCLSLCVQEYHKKFMSRFVA